MAILQTTKVTSSTEQMPGIGDGQSSKCIAGTFTSTVAPPLNDIIQSPLIQAGSIITDVWVVHSGLGAGGTFEVGYGGDTDYFVVSASQATGGVVRMSAVTAQPLVLTANDTVDVRITAAGATAAVTVTIIVHFLPRNT
jgi:hypothetical protein